MTTATRSKMRYCHYCQSYAPFDMGHCGHCHLKAPKVFKIPHATDDRRWVLRNVVLVTILGILLAGIAIYAIFFALGL